jgi:hypothetical protein
MTMQIYSEKFSYDPISRMNEKTMKMAAPLAQMPLP